MAVEVATRALVRFGHKARGEPPRRERIGYAWQEATQALEVVTETQCENAVQLKGKRKYVARFSSIFSGKHGH
jgi:hypothetical protein